MTEREKIIKVIRQAFEDEGRALKEQAKRVVSGEIKRASQEIPPLDEAIADALIAAGIGDTTNIIVENEVLQRDVDNLMRTLEEGTEEFQEVQHRADVAERALLIVVNEYRCEECPLKVCDDSICIGLIIEKYKKQAEKELAEEKKK